MGRGRSASDTGRQPSKVAFVVSLFYWRSLRSAHLWCDVPPSRNAMVATASERILGHLDAQLDRVSGSHSIPPGWGDPPAGCFNAFSVDNTGVSWFRSVSDSGRLGTGNYTAAAFNAYRDGRSRCHRSITSGHKCGPHAASMEACDSQTEHRESQTTSSGCVTPEASAIVYWQPPIYWRLNQF